MDFMCFVDYLPKLYVHVYKSQHSVFSTGDNQMVIFSFIRSQNKDINFNHQLICYLSGRLNDLIIRPPFFTTSFPAAVHCSSAVCQ